LIPLTLVVSLLSVAGCDDSGTDPTTTEPTTTEATTTLAPADPVVWPESGDAWDVLFIADRSSPIGDVVAEAYRQHAEDAVGAEVREVESPIPYPRVSAVLDSLQDDDLEWMWDPVRQAEIIVVQTWPWETLEGNEFGECQKLAFLEPVPPDPAVYEADEYSAEFRAALDDVYHEIDRLRDGVPTVLIGTDSYNPWYDVEQEAGIVDECREFFEWFSGVQRDIAEEHGAMWVSTHDVINGPGHDIDAIEAGIIGPSDAMPDLEYHEPNEVGSVMIANALANLGFEPNNQT
jgi:hypothetical protein